MGPRKLCRADASVFAKCFVMPKVLCGTKDAL